MPPLMSVWGASEPKQSPKTGLSQLVPTPISPNRKRESPHQSTDESNEKSHEPHSARSTTPHNPNKKPRLVESAQYPKSSSIVRWDNDNEKQNSLMQLAWDKKMQEGKQYTSTKCYKEVHVLMISWEESSDDLKVKREVETLGNVFKEYYNFAVHPVLLRNNTNKLPRHQIQKYVGDFVYDYDSPKALLIVYFAGHGTPGDHSGELQLHGNVDQVRAHRNGIIWNHTEGALRGTEVLTH